MRKIQFVNQEYYHLFNRGVDKREVFLDQKDLDRFFQSMSEFNTVAPSGGIYAASFHKNKPLRNLVSQSGDLVQFICYCLCPNHYHFILRQSVDRGIEKFMHRLGLGYTNYFNKKYRRSGSLFQGTFKANHIDSDEYLLYASVYVNLNYRIHQLTNGFFCSSWEAYIQPEKKQSLCDKSVILGQFTTVLAYKHFAENIALIAREKKELEKIIKLDSETT